jgi:hypothetical protein
LKFDEITDFESKHREGIIIVITAVAIGISIGMSSAAIGELIESYDLQPFLLLIILSVSAIIASLLAIMSFRILVLPLRLESFAYCRLLYNARTKQFVNPSAYLSYYMAQAAAE